MFLEVCCCLPQ